MKDDRETVELLRSQKAEVADILASEGMSHSDFEWRSFALVDDPAVPYALTLRHKASKYFFIFDQKTDDDGSEYWECFYHPGKESSTGEGQAPNWNGVRSLLKGWASMVKRELDAEDPWEEEREQFESTWTTSNDKFTAQELTNLDKRLGEIREYLIEQSDKSEETLQSIGAGIEELKESARKFGKKDWATLFVGWFFMHCADWTVGQVHWQHVVAMLLKGTKSFLLQG